MYIVSKIWKNQTGLQSRLQLMLGATLSLVIATCFSHGIGSDESQLQPLSLIPSDLKTAHQRNVLQNLIGDGYFDLWMIVDRTLRKDSTEFAVAIGRRPTNLSTKNIDDLPYFAMVSRAKAPIDSKESLKLGKSHGGTNQFAAPVPVEDTEIDISREDARNFIESWFAAMRTARYTDQIAGNDGVAFDFYSDGRAVHTWSPDQESIAGKLHSSGDCLIKYVTAQENVRTEVMSECRSVNAQLTKQVDELTKTRH